MDLGHGFIPRIDARNYRAVERCLSSSSPGLLHQALDLPWAIVEAPWAVAGGGHTLQLLHDRSVSFLVDTQAWRYRDARTFTVGKFASTPYAPRSPLSLDDLPTLRSFVAADLDTQARLGAAAFIVPGVVPRDRNHDVRAMTLALIDAAEGPALSQPRPCIAFVGGHTSSIERTYELIDELPVWLEGVYLQLTPVDPIRDSPSKIIEALALVRRVAARGFRVLGGRLAGIGLLASAAGAHGVDGGLGDGESFVYASKVASHHPRPPDAGRPRPLGGRVYVPQLGRSVSASEWSRLMEVSSLRGQLLCRLGCCAFRHIDTTPSRGREHSLHARVTEARQFHPPSPTFDQVALVLEERQSMARTVEQALRDAGLQPLRLEHTQNHLTVARYFAEGAAEVA